MLMMTGYFDETGDLPDVNRKINGMAGFIAPINEWLLIRADWEMHIVGQQYTDYHDSKIQGRSRKESRRKPLLDILENYNVLPIGWFVPMDVFRNQLTEHEQTLFGDPYYRAYLHCLFQIASFNGFVDQTKEERNENRVLTIFDKRNSSFRSRALEYYDEWERAVPGYAGRMFEEPIFCHAKNFIPLCMADMLCSVLREEYTRELYSPEAMPTDSYRRICSIADVVLDDGIKDYAAKNNYAIPFTFLRNVDQLRWYIDNNPYDVIAALASG